MYGVQQSYKKLDNETQELIKRGYTQAQYEELYYGDYFDNLPHEYENRTVDEAMQILLCA